MIATPLLLKCMKLLAADQMKWAQQVGKEEEVDIKVFVYLAAKGKTPWDLILGVKKVTEQDVKNACETCGVDSTRWLSGPHDRTKKAAVAQDMICGVVVPSDPSYQSFLKALGAVRRLGLQIFFLEFFHFLFLLIRFSFHFHHQFGYKVGFNNDKNAGKMELDQ